MLLKHGYIGTSIEMYMCPDSSIGKQAVLMPGSILDAVRGFDRSWYRNKGPNVILHLEVVHTLFRDARIECVVGKIF